MLRWCGQLLILAHLLGGVCCLTRHTSPNIPQIVENASRPHEIAPQHYEPESSFSWSPVLSKYIAPFFAKPLASNEASESMDKIREGLEKVDGMPDDVWQDGMNKIHAANDALGQDYINDTRDANAFLMALLLNSGVFALCVLTFSILRPMFPTVYGYEAKDGDQRAEGTDEHSEGIVEAGGGLFQVLLAHMQSFMDLCVRSHKIDSMDIDSDDECVSSEHPPVLGTGLFAWILPAGTLRYQDMLRYGVGLDITMLMAFTDLCVIILVQVGAPLIGLSFIIHNFFSEETHGRDRLAYFGMGCTKNKSWLYNVHAVMVWYVIYMVQSRVYRAQKKFLKFRFRWLKAMPYPRCKTLLVEGIPAGCRTDKKLKEFFGQAVPELPVQEAYVIRNTGPLTKTLEELEEAKRSLLKANFAWAKSGNAEEKRPKVFVMLRRQEEDAIQYYEEVVEALREKLNGQKEMINKALEEDDKKLMRTGTTDEERSEGWKRSMSYIGWDFEESAAATTGFVTFKTRRSAMMAIGLLYDYDEDTFVTSIPPAPEDVHYANLQGNPRRRAIKRVIGHICLAVLFFLCLPISFLFAALTNLNTLKKYPLVGNIIFALPSWLQAAIQGVSASLGMTILMCMFPTILMAVFSVFWSVKGHAYAQHELQVWYYWFLVVFVVLITSIGSSLVTTVVHLMEHPLEIFHLLSANLPQATNFYLNYMTMQWVLHGMNLTRYVNLFQHLFYRELIDEGEAKKLSEPEDQDYYGIGGRSARFTANMTIALVFSQLSPMITVLTCVNFVISRVIYTYLTVWAETRKPDLGGLFWVTKLRDVQFALFLYLLTMIGVFMSRGTTMSVFISLPTLILWYSNCQAFEALHWEELPLREIPGEDIATPVHSTTSKSFNPLSIPKMVRGGTGQMANTIYRQPELEDYH